MGGWSDGCVRRRCAIDIMLTHAMRQTFEREVFPECTVVCLLCVRTYVCLYMKKCIHLYSMFFKFGMPFSFPDCVSVHCVQLGDHLKLGMQSLGEALATHLAILGTALSEDDPKARKDLVNSTKAVKEKVCSNAIYNVSSVHSLCKHICKCGCGCMCTHTVYAVCVRVMLYVCICCMCACDVVCVYMLYVCV